MQSKWYIGNHLKDTGSKIGGTGYMREGQNYPNYGMKKSAEESIRD